MFVSLCIMVWEMSNELKSMYECLLNHTYGCLYSGMCVGSVVR